ncbi:Ail/Lom family outer membrane beta-barrel protein [Salmonella enterica]|nr:Ail/Lom family outer membrane beta-barrel protein [Salmonella enterica]
MNKLLIAVAVASVIGSVGVANAAAGDSTLSVGYAQIHGNGLKKLVNGAGSAIKGADTESLKEDYINDGYPSDINISPGHADKYRDPKGFNVKYRYEFTDNLGVIGSFTYAGEQYKGGISGSSASEAASEDVSGSIKARYFNISAGPVWRFNDWVSVYATGGVAFAQYSGYYSDTIKYEKTKDREASTENVGSGSIGKTKTEFAYGAGLQFNPVNNVAIDVAYEGTTGGDFKSNGFIVGVGYKF